MQLQFIIDAYTMRINQMGNYDYEALEKQVQKYEGEIRKHIRMEQQIKLYAESLQQKLEDSESNKHDLLSNSKSLMNSLKKENNELLEQIKGLKEDNRKLRSKLIELSDNMQDLQTSPCQDRQQILDQITLKSNSKYSTIDHSANNNKQRRYSKTNEEVIIQTADPKSLISHTLDSSILRTQYHPQRNDKLSMQIQMQMKPKQSLRDSDNKSESYRFRQYIPQQQNIQQRTLSQQQKQQQHVISKQQNIPIAKGEPKFDLKNKKVVEQYKHFLTTQNFIQNRSKNNSRQEQRHKKSISEHTDRMITSNHNKINNTSNIHPNTNHRQSQDYTEYLDQDI